MQRNSCSELRVLADFEGRWHIGRDIHPEQGVPARFEGQALWLPEANGLSYFEKGLLTMDGAAPMHAERRYHWAQDLRVFFDDGRFFHQVPAAGGQAEHWCDPDHYQVTYDFTQWPVFTATWDVRGPRKSYRMLNRFAPLATT